MPHPLHLPPLHCLVVLPTAQRARLLSVNHVTGMCHVQVLPSDWDDNDPDRLVKADELIAYDEVY